MNNGQSLVNNDWWWLRAVVGWLTGPWLVIDGQGWVEHDDVDRGKDW